MVKKPRLFYSSMYISGTYSDDHFYDCTNGECYLPFFYQSTALSVGFNSKFVFLDNYIYMFKDKDFLQALYNTFKLMLVIPALTIFLSLIFAFILTQGQLKEKSFYRTIFFFPSIVSMTVVGIVWSFVLTYKGNSESYAGTVSSVFLETCLAGRRENGSLVYWCGIGMAGGWLLYGYACSSIDGISQEVYEAASIDGATGVQKFFRITIPLLRRSIGTTYILSLSGTINLSFTLSNVMTGGGPNGASSVLLQYMYTQGMRNANFGYAMAIAMFTFALAVILAMISRKLSSEKE